MHYVRDLLKLGMSWKNANPFLKYREAEGFADLSIRIVLFISVRTWSFSTRVFTKMRTLLSTSRGISQWIKGMEKFTCLGVACQTPINIVFASSTIPLWFIMRRHRGTNRSPWFRWHLVSSTWLNYARWMIHSATVSRLLKFSHHLLQVSKLWRAQDAKSVINIHHISWGWREHSLAKN